MSASVVLLNGISGSGKTTLSGPLAEQLGMPVIAKDTIKEAFADLLMVSVPSSGLGALANETIWRLVALINGPVLVEGLWRSGRDESFLSDGLRVGGVERAIEVWCEVPIETALQRCAARPRHAIHWNDPESLRGLMDGAEPCSGQPVLRVSTDKPVAVGDIAGHVRAMLDDDRSRIARCN